jgi:hypothetical protein
MNTDLACQRAMDRLDKFGFDMLTDKEKNLATVWKLEAGVMNEGFAGYYSSADGDLAFHGPVALKEIGAHHLAQVVTEANALFGPAGPPRDRSLRQRVLGDFNDETRRTLESLGKQFLESNDDTDPLFDAYFERA